MDSILVLALALIIDVVIGEPPNRYHPVAWLGRAIGLELKPAPQSPRTGFVYGVLMVMSMIAFVSVPLFILLSYVRNMNSAILILGSALVLKFTFSWKGLRQAASRVRDLVAMGRIEAARSELESLVSRETVKLDREQIVSATVESVAENTCDSFVAPLFYYVLFGIPGAAAYRVVNTFDAMIGYHGRWEYIGKFAARLDDVLNYVPSRISALLIVLASWVYGWDPGHSWKIMWRDHGLTESPNAGWTMAAAAGALGVSLEKPGCYRLGDSMRALSENMISSSLKLLSTVTVTWSAACLAAKGVYLAFAG